MVAKRKIDEYYMNRALSLAWRGTGKTTPNPKVGCVLVRDGRVLGEGYHARCGGDHAEVAALKSAAVRGESVRGCTAYVTLEPCSHFGKTPPCAPRLVEEGIVRAVVGAVDPNPKVKGSGLEILRSAGLEVGPLCLEEQSKWLNRGFFRSKTLGRPWITLKAAAGLDGRLSLAGGVSKWITGEISRTWAHGIRALNDAVLVGVGTVLKDDPELTVRGVPGASPLRVVLDAELSTPPGARILQGGCLILTAEASSFKRERLERVGAQVCVLPAVDGRLDLSAVVAELNARGVQMLMVEGGPRVLGAFVKAGLCDSLELFVAFSLMGRGCGMLDELCFESMGEAVLLNNTRIRRSGEDFLVEGRFACSPDL